MIETGGRQDPDRFDPPLAAEDRTLLVCLHIGAHKTATTYMQSKLEEERGPLGKQGVGFIPHVRFRKTVADRLDAGEALGGLGHAVVKRTMAGAIVRIVESMSEHKRLILSDENIAGPMSSAIGASGLYPDIKRRLSAVAEPLGGDDLKVFFCVRSYADFFNSIYAYRVGQRKPQDLAVFRERAQTLKRAWPQVVADICGVVGPANTIVWTHEEFARSPERIGQALIGDWKPRVFVKTDKASLPSLSRKGMAVLDRASDLLSASEYAGLSRVVARFAFEPPDERFSMFEGHEVVALNERYADDLAEISRLGCKLIGVGPAAAPKPSPETSFAPIADQAPARKGGFLQSKLMRPALRILPDR